MATRTRLYKVETPTSVHLVEAPTPSRAISHIASRQITASIPPQHEVFQMAKDGLEIERVGDEPLSDETRSALAQEPIDA
ncbi:MAG: hypothetical protein Q7U48_13570 [Hydrogenophaga sp.]|nr:hypothetical protein [Hydrogenophaga sp.]